MIESSAPTLQDDTLDLLFDYVRGQTTGQIDWSDQLDSKGMQLFAAASVVVGLAGLGTPGKASLATYALFVGVGCYFLSAVAAFFMLRVRAWHMSGHADVLWAEHWTDTPRDIKHAVVADAAASVAHNRGMLADKARWLMAIQILLTIEVISVVVAMIASRLA